MLHRRRYWRLWGAAVALSIPCAGGLAKAEAAPPRLSWSAPASCPSLDDVRKHVAALSGPDQLQWARFEQIRGQVREVEEGWALELEFIGRGPTRRREVRARECGDMAEAAAVAIVLAHSALEGGALDGSTSEPDDTGNDAHSSSGGAPVTEAEASPAAGPSRAELRTPVPKPEAVDASQPEEEPMHPTLEAGVDGLLDPSTLGSLALGASLGLRLRLGPISSELYGAGLPAVERRVGAGQAVALGLMLGGLRGCYRLGPGLDTCAELEVGQLSASAVALARPESARDAWVAPGLSVELASAVMDALGVSTRISVLRPLIRGRFRVDQADVVHDVPAFVVRVALGIRVPLL